MYVTDEILVSRFSMRFKRNSIPDRGGITGPSSSSCFLQRLKVSIEKSKWLIVRIINRVNGE